MSTIFGATFTLPDAQRPMADCPYLRQRLVPRPHTLSAKSERLGLEATSRACPLKNAAVMMANAGLNSPFQMFHGHRTVYLMLLFLQQGFYIQLQQRKIENRGVPGFYLGPAPNYQSGTMRFLDSCTRHVIAMRDMMRLPTVMIPELGGVPSTASSVKQGRSADPSSNGDCACSNTCGPWDSEANDHRSEEGGSGDDSDRGSIGEAKAVIEQPAGGQTWRPWFRRVSLFFLR